MENYQNARRLELNKWIRTLRMDRSLSQTQIADYIGCSRARIANIEAGRGGYSLEELEVLTTLMGINPDSILKISSENQFKLALSISESLTSSTMGNKHICTLPKKFLIQDGQQPGKKLPHLAAYLTFSANEELIAGIITSQSAKHKQVLCIWEANSGKINTSIIINGKSSNTIAISPDNKHISYIEKGMIIVYDLQNKKRLLRIDPQENYPKELLKYIQGELGEVSISHMLFTEGGEYLVAYSEEIGILRLWNTSKWKSARIYNIYATVMKLGNTSSIEILPQNFETHLLGDFPVADIQIVPGQRTIAISSKPSNDVYYLALSKNRGKNYFWSHPSLGKGNNSTHTAHYGFDRGTTLAAIGSNAGHEDADLNLAIISQDRATRDVRLSSIVTGSIWQVAINEHGILGVIRLGPGDHWILMNFMTRQVVVIDSNTKIRDIRLSAKGNILAYTTPNGIYIRQIRAGVLSKNLPLPNQVSYMFDYVERKQNPFTIQLTNDLRNLH